MPCILLTFADSYLAGNEHIEQIDMKELKEFNIGIFNLNNSVHDFNFTFTDDFFSHFENSLINKGKGICDVIVTKTDSMIIVNMKIKGSIELECDRSLKLFDFPICTEREIIYKYSYSNEGNESSDDLFVLSKNDQKINISTFLYESISLEMPMKKLHPNFHSIPENDETIYFYTTSDSLQRESMDSRWEVLKKLK